MRSKQRAKLRGFFRAGRKPVAIMTRDAFYVRWQTTRDVFAESGALVDGAKLLDSVLADVGALFASASDETLTLREAASESGYSQDHLARLVRAGAIPNAGRARSPRIRRANLPRKAAALPGSPPRPQLVGADPEQIARSVVTSEQRGTR
jgi:hypothetical protein